MFGMAPDLVLAVGGMTLLAFGVWRIECMAPRRPATILLCVCGIVLIATAAARTGSNWSMRIAALGMYSGAGGSLGTTAATISTKRHAGAILASLGVVATTGFKIVSAIGISCGMLGVVMQALDAHRPSSLFSLVGQALIFSTFGIHAAIIARGEWRLADQGIIGPNVFVSWRHVSAWDWKDPNTLAIALKPQFLRARRFTIPVVPEARERAAAILASKIPA
jgi:hypothetical protein